MNKENFYITTKSFDTIEEFIDSIERGKEVGFNFNKKGYFIEKVSDGYEIWENKDETSLKKVVDVEHLLKYQIEGNELHNLILEAEITWRNQ